MRHIDVLWIEPAPPGSAASTHLNGTLRRLSDIGIEPRTVFSSQDTDSRLLSKLNRIAKLVWSARHLPDKGILLARWHPFTWFVVRHWQRRGGTVVLLVQGNDETVYETYPWFRRLPGAQSMIRDSIDSADNVLVLNEGLKKWVDGIRRTPSRASTIMETGVSEVFFSAEPARRERPYALFFGNLAGWQGIDYLIEAANSEYWPNDIDLVVVGEGEKSSLVRENASPRLHPLGRVSPAELAPLVAGALVTLCTKCNTPSMAETTTPFKILESVAAGVPVVATDIPAQRRMIEQGGYGLLVDPADPGELAQAVARLASDQELHAQLTQHALAQSPRLSWTYTLWPLRNALEAQ